MSVNRNGTTGREPSSPAPPSAHRSVRIAAIVGATCGVLCIVLGALQFAQGHGIVIFTLGCVLSVFWLVMIPGRRPALHHRAIRNPRP